MMFFVLMPILLCGLVLCPAPGTFAATTYCVSPGSTSEDCLGAPECCNLDYYLKNSRERFSSDKANISMIFMSGTHTSSSGKFNVTDLNSLTIMGESGNVTIESVEFNIKDVKSLHISSVLFEGNASVRVQPTSLVQDRNTVEVIDCKFIESSTLKTIRSNLTLSNCKFLHLTLPTSDNPMIVYNSNVNLTGSKFIDADQTAVLAFYSNIYLHNTVDFINNTGVGGGAMGLYSSRLHFGNTANVHFINNRALTIGGAIYVELGEIVRPDSDFGVFLCFYQVLPPLESNDFHVFFKTNSAEFGGEDIYGTYLNSSCRVSENITNSSFTWDPYNHFHFETNSMSSVSSTPNRVCVCDSDGKPKCADFSKIFTTLEAYPGETITVPVVIVGGDFGATIGTVYIGFVGYNHQSSQKVSQYQKCTNISYTLNPKNDNSSHDIKMHLSTFPYDDKRFFQLNNTHKDDVERAIELYNEDKVLSYALITTPVYINITLLDCPPGLSLRIENNTKSCDCHPEFRKDIQCHIDNNNIKFSWNSNAWIRVDTKTNNITKVLYSNNCPFDYCGDNEKKIDYIKRNDPDNQCAFNRAGTLCGGCRESFSLAIGSSRCIPCSNNNNLALLIFFAAAGFLLVLFISIMNLTVSQGMINGLVFYANIVWAYQSIVLTQEYNTDTISSGYWFFRIFLAWINLDFGIETCFFRGLNGYWKTWLQFIFPFYTAGLFLLGLQFSSKLSKLFGDRSVPTLATLLFMSNTKLLRTIIAALGLAQIKIFSNDSSVTMSSVWSIDGRYTYGTHPHIYLVLVAVACLLFLWLPYTLLLLLMQWLRKVPYSKPSQLITRYKPVFDTYYAPLKDKHHYWFGVLLLVQGILLFISSLTSNVYPNINLFLLLSFATLLLFYMSFMQVYRRTIVLIAESSFLLNLILLVSGFILFDHVRGQMAVLYASISIAFLEFCVIVVWSVVKTYFLDLRRQRATQRDSDQPTPVPLTYVNFRDSILEDSLTISTEKESSHHTRSSY